MKKLSSIHSCAVRFRRFTRKAYAVFNSLHKEISIGRMVVGACDSQLLKSHRAQQCVALVSSDPQAECLLTDPDELVDSDWQAQPFLLTSTPTLISAAPAAGASSCVLSIPTEDWNRISSPTNVSPVLFLCPQRSETSNFHPSICPLSENYQHYTSVRPQPYFSRTSAVPQPFNERLRYGWTTHEQPLRYSVGSGRIHGG